MSKPSRRQFLSVTAGAAAAALPLGSSCLPLGSSCRAATPAARLPRATGTADRCVFLNLVGGPPHLDTFDPKPDAPAEVRGPFRPIRTKVPGTHLSELFPRLATLADKFTLVRSLHHTAPPIHEAGFQLLNTGRLFRDGPEWPGVGAVVNHWFGGTTGWHILPHPEIDTGIRISHGLGAGWLPNRPTVPDCDCDCRSRSRTADLAALCRAAVELVRSGCRFVTVNQFATVFDAPSWDCHADGGSLRTDLNDIRDTVAPAFDAALARLLTDLDEQGLLDRTLVVATGEFGRTPRLNANGGRDHWAGAWTALVAGGGVRPGRVIGRTDATGTEPADRPVTPEELVASIFHALGVPPDATIPGPDGEPVAVYPAAPVAELF
jgi:hypothetical protein